VTAIGARTLRAWLAQPLTDPAKIIVRQRIIAELVASTTLRQGLQGALRQMGDLEQLADRCTGGATPEDTRRLLRVLQRANLAGVVSIAESSFLRALGRLSYSLLEAAAEGNGSAAGADLHHWVQRLGAADALCALAEVAAGKGWRCPVLVNEPVMHIRGGRHLFGRGPAFDLDLVPGVPAGVPTEQLAALGWMVLLVQMGWWTRSTCLVRRPATPSRGGAR
jgi:DNA mismatch repair ATPase MutS